MDKRVCLLTMAAVSLAQDKATFQVNTRLVEVDVVVRGNSGPIRNLKKEDFTVFDSGKPQTIATFSVRTSKNLSAAGTPLPAGTVSNRVNSRGEEPPEPTVIVWDALNTEGKDQAYVRTQVLKYLQTAKAGEPVALYGLGRTLHVLLDFTDDPAQLLRAAKAKRPEQSQDLATPDLTAPSSFNPLVGAIGGQSVRDSLQSMQEMASQTAGEVDFAALRDRVRITANALQAIGKQMTGLPGRKRLIWFSSGFPMLMQGPHETLEASIYVDPAIAALSNANVAVYPIDARGLSTGFVMSAPSPTPIASAKTVPPASLTLPGLDSIIAMAGATGGRPYYADNNLIVGIRTALQDDEVTYHLGFYPTNPKQDGSFHVLTVKARKGSDVRYRRGYLAMDTSTPAGGDKQDALKDTMRIPLEATQIGLRASAIPVAGQSGIYDLAVTVSLSDLHLEKEKDHWTGVLDYAVQFTPSESKGSIETVQINLTDERLQATAAEGFVFRRKLEVGSKSGKVRIAIADRATGAVGSVTVPIGK